MFYIFNRKINIIYYAYDTKLALIYKILINLISKFLEEL